MMEQAEAASTVMQTKFHHLQKEKSFIHSPNCCQCRTIGMATGQVLLGIARLELSCAENLNDNAK